MARLVVERGNEKGVSLNFDDFDCSKVIGRSSQCDLVLTSHMVSRRHFRVSRTDDLFTIEDLGSNNGTFVNGARIFEETLLLFGDRIRAGDTIFSFLSDMERNDGALAGQKIGGYHLLRRIGIGGMGEVYLATQMALSRTVALKILSPELTQDRAYVAKFVLEARSAGKLNHPNVVQVHEVGEENGVYFFSMEYVDGGSVQDLISRGRKLTPERIIDIAIQAAQALEYAEKQKIVHCDVKPDNLMLTKDGDVRLADLGIAKVMSSAGKAEQSEGVFGSPHYMAPEQTRGLPLDNRADLYSLGVTLYRCLSGKLPFSGNDAKEIMEKQVFEEPEPLKNLEPNLPPMLYTVVSKLMKKRPQDRYQSARDLITDLEKAREQIRQGIKASPRTSGTGPAVGRRVSRIRRRRPGWLGLLLVAAALAGGAALFSTLLAGTRDRADEARQVFAEAQEAEARSDFRTAEELYRKAVALAAKDNNRKDEAEYRKALEACRKRMADREAFEVARARFAGIRRAVERNEGNSLANLEAVRAFLAECRSDPSLDQLAREAAELERKCRERWNEESERECDATAETVRECLKRKDYDGAHLAIETFSRKYMGSTGWDGLEEGRRTLTDVLEKDMKAAVKASGEAMARGEYDRAVDVYSNFLERARLACEGRYRVEAERQIARLRAKIREARERGGGEKEKTDMA
ncbi:MAG: protein kinase, partial [Planctomycetota bacterium]|nr:protein kinase [Planctomycetota bacterium]